MVLNKYNPIYLKNNIIRLSMSDTIILLKYVRQCQNEQFGIF